MSGALILVKSQFQGLHLYYKQNFEEQFLYRNLKATASDDNCALIILNQQTCPFLKERLSRKTEKENEKHRYIIMVTSERVNLILSLTKCNDMEM